VENPGRGGNWEKKARVYLRAKNKSVSDGGFAHQNLVAIPKLKKEGERANHERKSDLYIGG